MKEQASNSANRKVRLIWFGLVIILTITTVLVIFNRSRNSNDRSYQQIELLKDSLLTQSRFMEKQGLFSSWMNMCQQKQILDVIQGKDSLTNKDRKQIRQIDQHLNTMLHERN